FASPHTALFLSVSLYLTFFFLLLLLRDDLRFAIVISGYEELPVAILCMVSHTHTHKHTHTHTHKHTHTRMKLDTKPAKLAHAYELTHTPCNPYPQTHREASRRQTPE